MGAEPSGHDVMALAHKALPNQERVGNAPSAAMHLESIANILQAYITNTNHFSFVLFVPSVSAKFGCKEPYRVYYDWDLCLL